MWKYNIVIKRLTGHGVQGGDQRELQRRTEGIRATEVRNGLIQNKGERIQVVGSDVHVLYPSLEAA